MGTAGIISKSPMAGDVFTYKYTYSILTSWDINQMFLVAMASRYDGSAVRTGSRSACRRLYGCGFPH
jgi:hypothetical protein